MNPLTNIKNINKLNEVEADLGLSSKVSWHQQYSDSAYIFIGGLPYKVNEGDILAVFSQYGEIVNINLVRDKKTGKSQGYCFIAYEDQRSTILAVDNFNGIQLLGRTIRVDHVENYRKPKEDDDDDDATKELRKEGCAPKIESPFPPSTEDDFLVLPIKKIKKEKKSKKEKKDGKKNKKKNKERTNISPNSSSEADPADNNIVKLDTKSKTVKSISGDKSHDRATTSRHQSSERRKEGDYYSTGKRDYEKYDEQRQSSKDGKRLSEYGGRLRGEDERRSPNGDERSGTKNKRPREDVDYDRYDKSREKNHERGRDNTRDERKRHGYSSSSRDNYRHDRR